MAETEETPEGFKKCKGKGDLPKCDNQFEDYPHGILPATPEFFHRNKRTRDGFRSECKVCRKKYHKEQYEAYHADPWPDTKDFEHGSF